MDQQTWTIMVYMAGDNNLSVDMAYAMEQIAAVAGDETTNVNLCVYYDGSSPSVPTLYCDFSDSNNPRNVRSHVVTNKLYPVEEGEQNESAADPKSVLNFVDWCANKVAYEKNNKDQQGRKADRYALIFSGHSLGFQDIGLYRDETAAKAMTMEALHDLLEEIVSDKILGQKLDILGFDSCVMSMLEVGYQFDDIAKTLIASEGSVPSAGWTYAKILGNLVKSNNLPTKDIAANFVHDFVKSQDNYTIGGVAVDMAAWDFSELPKLVNEFEELSQAISACFETSGKPIYRQMERLMLQVHWKCQTYMYEQNVDLGDFCELLGIECRSFQQELGEAVPLLETVEKHCAAVLTELKNTVILSGFSGGTYQYSNGISLFFPWSKAAYDVSKKNYESLRFVQETGAGKSWNQFLQDYLHIVTLRPSPPVTADAVAGAAPDVVAYEMAATKERYIPFDYEDQRYQIAEFESGAEAVNGQSGTKMPGQSGTKMPGQSGTKMPGQSGTKMPGQSGTKMPGQSGTKMPGQSGTKMPGQSGTKMPGQSGTKMPGQSGTKMPGQSGTKMPGQSGTKMPGQSGTKMPGQSGTKMPGQSGTKMPGQSGTKMPGQSGTKMPGQSGTKMPGQSGTKMPGQSGTKMPGQSGTKMPGQSGTKMPGGGDSSSAFFGSFQQFKNLDTPWNISGFTKKQDEPLKEPIAKKKSG